MQEYKVVHHEVGVHFSESVNNELKQGWKVTGGLTAHNGLMAQALYRKVKEVKKAKDAVFAESGLQKSDRYLGDFQLQGRDIAFLAQDGYFKLSDLDGSNWGALQAMDISESAIREIAEQMPLHGFSFVPF